MYESTSFCLVNKKALDLGNIANLTKSSSAMLLSYIHLQYELKYRLPLHLTLNIFRRFLQELIAHQGAYVKPTIRRMVFPHWKIHRSGKKTWGIQPLQNQYDKSSQRSAGKIHVLCFMFYSPSQERVRHFSRQEGVTRIFPRKDIFAWPKKEGVEFFVSTDRRGSQEFFLRRTVLPGQKKK